MRLDLTFEKPGLARETALAASGLRTLVRLLSRKLRELPEWEETCEILGQRPQCVSLFVCGDEEMRRIHREFRKLDRTTDVLSFPAREAPPPALRGGAEDVSLGDLVVAWPSVERAAKRARRRPEAELAEVVAHGLLHLVGLDHVGVPKRAADRMKRLQRKLSRAALAAITRPHVRTSRRTSA